MDLSPTKKHRTLSRQPSLPSLAVGLPPPLPDHHHHHSNIMGTPSTNTRSATKKNRKKQPSRRGDVSSSAASSPSVTDDEWVMPTTPGPGLSTHAHPSASSSTLSSSILATDDEDDAGATEITPKRKVIATLEGSKTQPKPAKREGLQARLQAAAAAKLKTSKSHGQGLVASASISQLVPKVKPETITASASGLLHGGAGPSSGSGGSDKVIVCVRVKPTDSPFVETAYELTSDSLTLTDNHPNVQKRGGKAGREDEYTYNFDALLQFPSRTPDLYEQRVAPLVNKAMNGYNSTIFAYGQTGSGKSFTMTGVQSELGIIPCAVDGVFDAINADPERAFLLRVSYIEIYNESLRDLLNFKKGPLKDDEKPNIHFNKGKVYVDPLVEEIVSTPQDVVDLLEKGNTQRKTGATDWNERSSRSHSVFTIVIESKPRDGDGDDDVRLSRLTLIDLAGSEKAVSDLERRGEGKHINRSLLALKNVINKLTDKKSAHIPYRDSKLTHLLENALGGDSNICVICTLSVEEDHHAETLETLKFAGNCARVETKAKKNILTSSDKALIKAKDKEIEILKRRLQGLQHDDAPKSDVFSTSNEIQELADSVSAMEARKYRLTTQLAKLNTQVLTSEFPRVGAALHMVSPKPKRRRISDIQNALATSRVGLGSPKQLAMENRRAVSTKLRMPQVPEDDLPALHSQLNDESNKPFDHDRIVAALRRAITTRDQDLRAKSTELDTAIAQLTQLQEQLVSLHSSSETTAAEHESAMLDFHAKLESTRTELVATVDEKASKIDALETTVLDLRTSREELLLESGIRTDELKAHLDAALQETTTLKDLHAVETDQLLADVDRLRTAADKLPDIQSKLEEAESGRLSAVQALDSHQQASLARETELDKSRTLLEKTNEELKKLQSELSIRQGLEGDQTRLEAMLVSERAGRKMAEEDNRGLVSQLAELRELRMKAKEWEAEKSELVRQVDSTNSTLTTKDAELVAANEAIKATADTRKATEEHLNAIQAQMKETKDQLHDQSSEVFRLQMQLSTNTAESSNQINSLESQLLAERDRARHLDEVKTTLSEKQRQLDESAAEVGRLRDQIDSSSSSSKEQIARLASLEEQLRTESTLRQSNEESKSELEAQVVDLRTAIESHETEVSNLSRELEIIRKKLESAEHATETESFARRDLAARLESKTEELVACQSALEVAKDSANGVTGDVQRLTNELAGLQRDLEVARLAAETLSKSNDSLESRLATSHKDLAAHQITREEVEKTADSLRAILAEKETALTTLSARLDEERKLRSRAEEGLKSASATQSEATNDLRQQLESSQQALATSDKNLSEVETSLQSAQAGNADLVSRLEKLTSARKEAEVSTRKTISDLEGRLETTARALNTTLNELQAAKKEQEQFQTRLKMASDDDDRRSHAANTQIRELEKQLQDTLAKIGNLEAGLVSARTDRTQTESLLEKAGREHEKALKQSQASLAVLQKQYGEQSRILSTARSELESQSKALKRAESVSSENQRLLTKIEQLSSDLATQKSKSDHTCQAFDQAKLDLSTANATIQRLTGELKSAKAAQPTPRNASAPTTGNTPQMEELRIQALKTASTGDGNFSRNRLRTKENEEIEKLEKVIETQVEIINDQAEKIRFWSKELEQQRDIVRMLTQDGTLNITPTKRSPHYTHSKSKSLSVADLENQSPGPGSTHAKVYLPSSFTAKNLALPTTPTPLPMHPSQFSNTTMRKGRRVTIDHDLDLLTESSKVNKAKAVFDSPDKEERAAIALSRKKTVRVAAYPPVGSPVQRRP